MQAQVSALPMLLHWEIICAAMERVSYRAHSWQAIFPEQYLLQAAEQERQQPLPKEASSSPEPLVYIRRIMQTSFGMERITGLALELQRQVLFLISLLTHRLEAISLPKATFPVVLGE